MLKATINSEAELNSEIVKLLEIIDGAKASVKKELKSNKSLDWIYSFKFKSFVQNPHSGKNEMTNLFEFSNQVWTTIATYLGLKYFYSSESPVSASAFKLNLGVDGGTDIVSKDRRILAEVFATTRYSNNSKLREDIARLAEIKGKKSRFVFVLVPSKEFGDPQKYKPRTSVGARVVIRSFDMTDVDKHILSLGVRRGC